MLLGFLEKCLECGGKALVKREEEIVAVSSEIPVVKDCLTTSVEPGPAEAPRCPKHPGEPQIQCSSDGKRAGQYMGACKVCMAERKIGRKAGKVKEKMTPAVARDLGKKAPTPPLASLGGMDPDLTGDQSTEEYIAEMRGRPLEAQPDKSIPTCPRPDCAAPGSPVKFDKLNRSMGMCAACVSARGRKWGKENNHSGKTSPPVAIPLNQAEYADLKAWLEEQAQEYERTLQREIMYRLKLAMREAV